MNVLERLDSSLLLTEDERMVFENVYSLAREKIAPRAQSFDLSGEFPWENVNEINKLGLNGMFVPEEFGGAGLSYLCYLLCVREISKACASTGIIWATNFHAMKPVIDFGSEELKQRLLPSVCEGALASLVITESEAGSDAKGMKTQFVADGDDIIINGSKCFITNGDVSDILVVFGVWEGGEDTRKALSVLVLEKGTPGFTVVGKEKKLGHRASSTCSLAFDGCRVPRANLVGDPGDGLEILLASLNKSRPSIAAQALGIARAAFEDSVGYINERKQSGRRIIDFQGIQFMVADLASELLLCESGLWNLARKVDGGAADFGVEASILKMRASDLAMKAAIDAVQLFGGYGYCSDYRVERLMRDAKITQIWEGTNQVHRQIIGKSFIHR